MKTHRGLSAVVGTVFLIAIVIGAMSYISYSLDIMGNFSESLITEESRQKDKQGESFEISSIQIASGDKLDGVIKNSGEIPVKLTTLYIDEQGVNDRVQKYTLDATISSGKTVNIIDLVDVDINGTKGYNMKVVSSRGQVNSFYVNSASSEPLFMNLVSTPQIVSTGFSTSLLFTVVNNMSNNNSLYNLTPKLSVTSPNGLASANYITGPNPASYPVLSPGDVAIFEYVYAVAGDEGESIDFGLWLDNGYVTSPGYIQHLNTTVAVKTVELALKSGTAITSFGLESFGNQARNILVLHDESFNTPASIPSLQMDASDANGVGGVYNSLDDAPIIFFTANMTQEVNMTAPGIWNASLQYYSNFTDSNTPEPSFAFFFDCYPCGNAEITGESTGNLFDIENKKGGLKVDGENVKDAGNTFPIWRNPTVVTDGPDGDGYWSFIDNDGFLKDDWKQEDGANVYANVGFAPDTDAVWVRIPTGATVDDYMPLIYYGDEDEAKAPNDKYMISIGSAEGVSADTGKFSFEYRTNIDSDVTTCTSSAQYHQSPYLGNWQHVVAVRESDGDCNLYVNGSKVAGPITGSGGTNEITNKKVGIGTVTHGKTKASNDLYADVASWLHWEKALDQTQITNLFHTNYGNNATRIHITINQTDGNGGMNPISCPNCEVIVDTATIELPFHDPSVNSPTTDNYFFRDYLESNADSWEKNSQANATLTISGTSRIISIDNRLAMSIQTEDTDQNLPINIKVGDANFPGNSYLDATSFLQTGPMTPSLPTYLTIGDVETVELTIFNEGPEGLWFTFPGTRFVLTSNDGVSSFAAMPCSISVNGGSAENLDSERDGPYIPDQANATVRFYELTDPPFVPPFTGGQPDTVDVGEYLAAVYLSGFDEAGEAFLRTIKLGTVQIVSGGTDLC